MDKEQVAELLKEVGEPVAIVGELSEPTRSEVVGKGNPLGRYLFTSDQVAAAILKATKPLEDRLAAEQEEWNQCSGLLDDALRSIGTLEDQLAAAQEEIVSASKDSLRLLETVKYLRGIAERGEEREQKEDETVEQFVLGYVKKLEDQLAAAQEEIERWKNGGYTNLWKQRTEDRDETIERQRLTLLELRDQLAKAEQRVAEACANYVNRFINGDGILNEVWISDIESALRSGEWRKFVKEV